MDIAALDLGSNSFHLLVGRSLDGRILKLESRKVVLALGAHVHRTGRIPPREFLRGLEVVEAMLREAHRTPNVRVAVVGTSALREAVNGIDFARAVLARTGVGVEILSGDVEGRLVFDGARSALVGLPRRLAVVDIGGGSVEIAVGEGAECRHVTSLQHGFLRVHGQVEPDGAERVRALVSSEVRRVHGSSVDAWVFSGGTARAFGKLAQALRGADPRRMSARLVQDVAELVSRMDARRLRALGVDAARSETLVAGTAVLAGVVDGLGAGYIAISPGGLREGVILREARAAVREVRRNGVAAPPDAITSVSLL